MLVVLALSAAVLRADKLTLNNGTVIEGTVIKQSTGYWVKTADGESRIIPASDVASLVKSGAAGAPQGNVPGAMAPAGGSTSYDGVSRKIAAADTIGAVISILNDYIKTNPAPDDLKKAKDALVTWTDLATSGAEKINGKWVSGAEYKAIVEKSITLVDEAIKLAMENQMIQSIAKLNEANKVYPNSFDVNFWLGYTSLMKESFDEAAQFFEKATKLNPKSPEATANLGLVYFKKKQFEKAILQLQKAAELGDTPEIAIDLVAAISLSPEQMQRNAKIKGAIEAAHLLASKYHIPDGAGRGGFVIVRLVQHRTTIEGAPPGAITSGTGFVVASDGVILTNRHVVKGGKSYEVILQGGAKVPAEVIIIDDEQDLALVRIKPPSRWQPSNFPTTTAPATALNAP